MNIIYPPLVEQSFQFYQRKNSGDLSKTALYRSMVANQIITENGHPTAEAIERGFVRDFYEEQDLSFEEFLAIYPIFTAYETELFQKIDGFWEIPVSLKNELMIQLEQGKFSYDEQVQVEAFLSER
ncbi:hypothetical protein [Candidatus Enterococcus courvalinii]|uniref:Uncharacterized protein n=1 Tax=Candidatus Enterococcus courvalinii TaxID=2815329 RepID=A0ABS3HX62_9ENTE|nr:hypothetical protein [Enterococcus sp. MSG2901]MBO0481049.1 hypothetical protein [Enterococcus sp. MSG2901]